MTRQKDSETAVPVRIPSPRGQLFGMLHGGEPGGVAVVMCPPFGEEKKTTYRIFFELAEMLSSSGIPVLRFDYSGTGDSDGDFSECDLNVWTDDIRAASKFLLSETDAGKLCLLGLRIGGTLAVRCESNFLILWQPMIDPGTYFKANVRRQLLRYRLIRDSDTVTYRRVDDGSPEMPKKEIDGYHVSDGLARSMEEATTSIDHPDCLLVQVSYSEKVLPEYAPYENGPGIEFKPLRLEPFWNRLGRVDVRPLMDVTSEWIKARA